VPLNVTLDERGLVSVVVLHSEYVNASSGARVPCVTADPTPDEVVSMALGGPGLQALGKCSAACAAVGMCTPALATRMSLDLNGTAGSAVLRAAMPRSPYDTLAAAGRDFTCSTCEC
jgi:hypothetical protein